jgi:hypothetical protein
MIIEGLALVRAFCLCFLGPAPAMVMLSFQGSGSPGSNSGSRDGSPENLEEIAAAYVFRHGQFLP